MRTRWLPLLVGLPITIPATTIAQARVEKNVVIGMYSGLALVMDVHLPEKANGYAIVHISGSGFGRPLAYSAPLLSESQVNLWGKPLVDKGYTVFSLNHRAIPRFQFPAPLEDVQRAVRFVRLHANRYGIDARRIGAVGGSSGGHLVLMLGVLDGHGDSDDPDPVNRVSAKVQVVVARAAPSNLARYPARPNVALLLGTTPPTDSQSVEFQRYWNASPVNFVTEEDPPILLIHGDADEQVPFEQGQLMYDALKAKGVKTDLIRVPGAGHGPEFPGAKNPPDYMRAMIDWFDRHLKAP